MGCVCQAASVGAPEAASRRLTHNMPGCLCHNSQLQFVIAGPQTLQQLQLAEMSLVWYMIHVKLTTRVRSIAVSADTVQIEDKWSSATSATLGHLKQAHPLLNDIVIST